MTREEVIEKLNELKIIFEDCMVDAEGDRDAAEALKNNQDSAKALDIAIKALEQEPKTGHWIEVTNGRGGHECDLCHEYAPSYKDGDEWLTKYCPNCGADMREVEE
jgi:hypothetical protein